MSHALIEKDYLVSNNAHEIMRFENWMYQEVVIYEDPVFGDEATLLGVIGDVAFDTGFYDCGDYEAGGDYIPVLIDGEVVSTFECDEELITKHDDEYIFTFGFGQKHEGCYTSIRAKDWKSAREQMVDKFGKEWGFQYDPPNARKRAGVGKYDLKQVK